jgi:polyisoprenoid-binding protein YceI
MMATFTNRNLTMALVFMVSTGAATVARAQSAEAQNTNASQPVEVRGGTASFDVDTNMPALSVHGKSNGLEGRVRVRRGPEGPQLEQIEAKMPVETLQTGLKLRDEHMRKYIFTTSDGQTPDVRFVAEKATCSGSGKESTCQVAGDLTIRGTAKPFTIALKVTENNGTFRATGDSVVKLSTYGIEKPSQLGVRTEDEVKLKLDFTARPAPVATTGATK